MKSISESIYIGRDNTIELALSVDGVDLNHTGIVRCQVKIGSTMIDSDVTPELFDFTHADRLVLMFGDAGLNEGECTAKLYVFDANNQHGLYWGEFQLTVSS